MHVAAYLSEQQKELIIGRSMPYIRYTAYRLARRLPPPLSVHDLIHIGIIGLLEALERYREGRVKLQTFVEYRIKGAMLDELRSQDWTPRSVRDKNTRIRKSLQRLEQELGRTPRAEEVAKDLGIGIEEYHRALRDADTAAVCSFDDCRRGRSEEPGVPVVETIADPDARTPLVLLELTSERRMLAGCIAELPHKERLILSLYYWNELTMKEIGKAVGVSEGRVCQIHHHALKTLRSRMGSLGIS